eukprot:3668722-Pleurochrysis_carterae.AAC.3
MYVCYVDIGLVLVIGYIRQHAPYKCLGRSHGQSKIDAHLDGFQTTRRLLEAFGSHKYATATSGVGHKRLPTYSR